MANGSVSTTTARGGNGVAQGPRIGAQLRAARLAQRRTVADLAQESGLTKGFVSKLERDQASASVASLMRLCETLDIPVGSLFHASTGEIVRREERPPINFGGDGIALPGLKSVCPGLLLNAALLRPGSERDDQNHCLEFHGELSFRRRA